MTPQIPFVKCTGTASTASSIRSLSRSFDESKYKIPPTAPIIIAHHGVTVAQPAVIATSPDRAPFIAAVKSYDASPVWNASIIASKNKHATAPDAAASVVVTAARAETLALPALVIIKIEPTMKANTNISVFCWKHFTHAYFKKIRHTWIKSIPAKP